MDVFSRRLDYRNDRLVDVSWSIAAASLHVRDVVSVSIRFKRLPFRLRKGKMK